jgi:hypothetical protein
MTGSRDDNLHAKSNVLREVTQTVQLNIFNIAMNLRAVYFFTIFISTFFSNKILPHELSCQLYLTVPEEAYLY